MTDIHVTPASQDTELCELFRKYGSDKCDRHDYGRYYHELFKQVRTTTTRFFELGIFGGASLRAWRDYFPNASIIGADIDPGMVSAIKGERIHAFVCDETSEEQVKLMWLGGGEAFGLKMDIIIDDALHTLEDNCRFFEWSKHMLRSGGLYIFEDIPAHEIDLAKGFAADMRGFGWAAHVLVIPRVVNGEDVPDNSLLIMRAP